MMRPSDNIDLGDLGEQEGSYLCAYCQLYFECVKNQATKPRGCPRFKDSVAMPAHAETAET